MLRQPINKKVTVIREDVDNTQELLFQELQQRKSAYLESQLLQLKEPQKDFEKKKKKNPTKLQKSVILIEERIRKEKEEMIQKESEQNQFKKSATLEQRKSFKNNYLHVDSIFQLKEQNTTGSIISKISKFKMIIMDICHNQIFQFVIQINIIYSLFGDDIRNLIIDNRDYDNTFSLITFYCMILFAIEIIMKSYVEQDYWNGFYFHLDVISTVTMIFDVQWISDALFEQNSASQTVQLTRAARSSRIATRMVRIIRIIRMIRLAKVYQSVNKVLSNQHDEALNKQIIEEETFKNNKKGSRQNNKFGSKTTKKISPMNIVKDLSKRFTKKSSEQSNEKFFMKETQVGKKLTELTIKRTIFVVLAVLICVPVFIWETYITQESGFETSLQYLYQIHNGDGNLATNIPLKDAINSYKYFASQNTNQPLLYLKIKQDIYQGSKNLFSNKRDTQILQYLYMHSDATDDDALAIFDQTQAEKDQALLSLTRTIFVCIVLTGSSIIFSKECNNLVIIPIENMLSKIDMIAKNPLDAANMEQKEAIQNDLIEDMDHNQLSFEMQQLRKSQQNAETAILEKTILKIGALLALGFGEAGTQIISENLKQNGEINPMIAGKKVMAIFGFCDIRNFTSATEILQEQVMIFVNEVAEITHSIVDSHNGSPNKNIGDAFLLVWKFPQDQILFDFMNNEIEVKFNKVTQQLFDMSVVSLLKVLASIQLSQKLKKYQHHKQLTSRMPNFRIKLGLGLHFGWAIEGAIGSHLKIDASYLSCNVNMAQQLEEKTKTYGVPILISGEVVQRLTIDTRQQMREIDIVWDNGSNAILKLYTCDVDLDQLEKNVKISSTESLDNLTIGEKRKQKFKNKVQAQILKDRVIELKTIIHKLYFGLDKEIKAMRETYNSNFYQTFEIGYQSYIKGKWEQALQQLKISLNFRQNKPQDGPSQALIEFMEQYDGVAPSDWKGYRYIF